MVAFKEVLKDCELNDLSFTREWFTWERGTLEYYNIRERLERGMANFAC